MLSLNLIKFRDAPVGCHVAAGRTIRSGWQCGSSILDQAGCWTAKNVLLLLV